MSLLEDLSTELANKALDKAEELGDEDFPNKVAQTIGASSPTLEENYRTAVRLIRASRRARTMIAASKPGVDVDIPVPDGPKDPPDVPMPGH